MSVLNGKWQLTSSEGFEQYMKQIGVTEENRAKGSEVLEKKGEGGLVEEYIVEPGKSVKRNLYLGETMVRESPSVPFNVEVTGPSVDGRIATIKITEEGPNKFSRAETFEGGISALTVGEIKGNELFTTLTSGGVVAKRTYKKI